LSRCSGAVSEPDRRALVGVNQGRFASDMSDQVGGESAVGASVRGTGE
jgi:hypothetical protein